MNDYSKFLSDDQVNTINEFQNVIREIMPEDARLMSFTVLRNSGWASISSEDVFDCSGGEFRKEGIAGSTIRSLEKYEEYRNTAKQRALAEYERSIEKLNDVQQIVEEAKAKLDALS